MESGDLTQGRGTWQSSWSLWRFWHEVLWVWWIRAFCSWVSATNRLKGIGKWEAPQPKSPVSPESQLWSKVISLNGTSCLQFYDVGRKNGRWWWIHGTALNDFAWFSHPLSQSITLAWSSVFFFFLMECVVDYDFLLQEELHKKIWVIKLAVAWKSWGSPSPG